MCTQMVVNKTTIQILSLVGYNSSKPKAWGREHGILFFKGSFRLRLVPQSRSQELNALIANRIYRFYRAGILVFISDQGICA